MVLHYSTDKDNNNHNDDVTLEIEPTAAERAELKIIQVDSHTNTTKRTSMSGNMHRMSLFNSASPVNSNTATAVSKIQIFDGAPMISSRSIVKEITGTTLSDVSKRMMNYTRKGKIQSVTKQCGSIPSKLHDANGKLIGARHEVSALVYRPSRAHAKDRSDRLVRARDRTGFEHGCLIEARSCSRALNK